MTTGPTRWRESDDVPEEIARMVAAGRPTRPMPAGSRARMARRLGVAAVPSAAALLLSGKGVALAGAISVVALSVGAHLVRSSTAGEHVEARAAGTPAAAPRAPAPAVRGPSAVAIELAPAQPPTAPSATHSVVPSAAPGTGRPPKAVPPPADDTLEREVALLERARSVLDADPAAALGVLEEHARRFPQGKLSVERELLALDTLQRLGRTGEARERARRLLLDARGTIYEDRVRSHLGQAP
jgi:hypothetical protein